MQKLKNYASLDVAKYVGALLVVAIHTFPFQDISPSFNLFFISTICRLAVPFFFVCSSFFLFRKMKSRPSRQLQIFMKWFRRLLILYLVWSAVYLPYVIWNYSSAGFGFFSLFGLLRDFLLNGTYYHLWFLPALMLGGVIGWQLVKKFGLPKALMYSMLLYLFGWLVNIFGPFWQTVPGISLVYGFLIKLLGTVRDGFFFAPVFVVVGMLCASRRRPPKKACAVGFGISFLCLILEVTLYAFAGVLNDLSSMFLCLVPCAYFLMCLLLQVRLPWKGVYREMRQESTLIYVSHILFARILLMLLPSNHLVVYLGTLFLAQMFSYLLIKGSRQIGWLKVFM